MGLETDTTEIGVGAGDYNILKSKGNTTRNFTFNGFRIRPGSYQLQMNSDRSFPW
jgi:molybdopterin biosynthesis enzyme